MQSIGLEGESQKSVDLFFEKTPGKSDCLNPGDLQAKGAGLLIGNQKAYGAELAGDERGGLRHV
jgi:hypothetical protein